MRSLDRLTVDRWTRELNRRGLSASPFAAGVEGAVFRVTDESIVKVWNSRSEVEVAHLKTFYDAIGSAGLPFLTPRIERIGRLSDAVYSVEAALPGRPLYPAHTGESPTIGPTELQCVTEVLDALARVTPTEPMTSLPVLVDEVPLALDRGFDRALADLVLRRVETWLAPMQAALAEIPELARDVAGGLAALPPRPDGLIHGDLIPANILVERRRVTSVLDFGFFTTVGPPTFDAAVTAAIFDMYGPRHDANHAAVREAVQAAFDYSTEVLQLFYLAAYALTTMTMYGTNEDDGHFRWCVGVLRRPFS